MVAAMMMIVAVAVGYGDGGGDDGGLWCSFVGAAYGAGQSVSLCNGKRPRLNVSSLREIAGENRHRSCVNFFF